MSAATEASVGRRRAQPRTQRYSLRMLRFRTNLPRYVLYAVAIVAIVRAVLPNPSGPHPKPAPARPAGNNDLPAQSLAVEFTRAYLTYDASNPQERDQALASLVGQNSAALNQGAGVVLPIRGSDQVTSAQLASQRAGVGGTTYTVQADTTTDGVVYLAVTVARHAGALRLVGEPALVGPPRVSAAVQDPASAGDQQVSDGAVSAVVTRALTNYLKGNQPNLQSDLATGVSVTVPTMALSQIQIGQIDWLTQGHSVGVSVQANDKSGATYALHYTVALERQPSPGGSRWFVSGINSTPGP
jgi:hypothetical protein